MCCEEIQQGKESTQEQEHVRAAKRKEQEEKVIAYYLEDEATIHKAKQHHKELYQEYLTGEVPNHSTHQHQASAAALQAAYGLGKVPTLCWCIVSCGVGLLVMVLLILCIIGGECQEIPIL